MRRRSPPVARIIFTILLFTRQMFYTRIPPPPPPGLTRNSISFTNKESRVISRKPWNRTVARLLMTALILPSCVRKKGGGGVIHLGKLIFGVKARFVWIIIRAPAPPRRRVSLLSRCTRDVVANLVIEGGSLLYGDDSMEWNCRNLVRVRNWDVLKWFFS